MQIFLVIISIVNGQTFETRFKQPSIEVCYDHAAKMFKEMQDNHREAEVFGIGCSLDRGAPA